MSENKSNKKLIIIVLALLLLVAGLFIIKPWNKQDETVKNKPEVIEPCTDCTVEKDNPFNLSYSGETITYNAYDFIIEKMSQAQYWTHDEFQPRYVVPDQDHKFDETIINGTGFILYDENTASFVRGCEGRLIINFSNYTAESDTNFGNYYTQYEGNNFGNKPIDIINDKPYSGEQYFIDYNNHTEISHYSNDLDDTDDIVLDFENRIALGNNYPGTLELEIKNTFEFYEAIFSALDIPLLNQPVGTLASYKNKTIEVPVELVELKYWEKHNDDLIHSPYDERVGFDYYWERNKNNVWLDDYRDIMDKQFPKSTGNETKSFYIVELDAEKTYNYYAPLFLCLADIEPYTKDDDYGGSFTGTYTEHDRDSYMGTYGTSRALGTALTTYWLRPLYEHIFGFNGVYFVNMSKLENNPNKTNTSLTFDEFEEGIKADTWNNIVSVFNKGDYATDSSYTLHEGWDNGLIDYMNKICEHYGVENPYGSDFVYNMYLVYSQNEQASLGLR